ncbi:hypothetical protein Q73A0000_01400 [Kaistella flava (ex Peng et al. 2021)]|uniref:Phage integrase SAM-like domain-containing protein n=1 Tax=Kaistella flava (ex Peng et al. 2021) TaxID=2038776 RepID=A0A7M2Y4D9_9FLAO|nr:phage integrase SAM-like domain-containing protein [Kaistella flava (ex Peng et al. 2021)]QOW09098.1 hypothetical protein Q73A0000_01400 [Kaistella flava (ex Peng et al. 2021)]
MATVNFLYRSSKDRAPLTVRLQFWIGKKPDAKAFFLDAKSNLFISAKDWELYRENKNTNNRDAAIKNLKLKINTDIQEIEELVLSAFAITEPELTNKKWLQNIVNQYYFPELIAKNKASKEIPTDLVSYIDFFIENEELNDVMKSKYRVLKSKLETFQAFRRKTIEIYDIDNLFRREFITYSREVANYAEHTINRDFGYISTLCKSAGLEGIELHKKHKDFKAPQLKKIIHEILNPEEILIVENLEGLMPSLDNVRDLFLVSLYTGQRISDFMRFNKEMIREENGQRLLEFEQSKTGELMSIPIIPKLEKILQKHGGNFPRKISDAKYNEYLKKVLEKAGFTNEVWGRKLIEISEGVWRKKDVKLPRYQFFSSHSGRRSFASNAFGKMPISDIMYLTGHVIEKTFLVYVNKKKTDRAHEAAPKLAALYSDDTKDKDLLNQLQELIKNKHFDIETLIKNLKNDD